MPRTFIAASRGFTPAPDRAVSRAWIGTQGVDADGATRQVQQSHLGVLNAVLEER